jgi:hypothetical protein
LEAITSNLLSNPEGPNDLKESDPLHASDLFSKDTYLNEKILKYKDSQQQLRNKSSIKIQQLFQETRDLNKRLFEVKQSQMALRRESSPSESPKRGYTPVRNHASAKSIST